MLNQAGKFCAAGVLLEDRMDGELRQIAAVLRKKLNWPDLKTVLVDRRISLPRWDMKIMENRDAAAQINNAVEYLLSDLSDAELEEKLRQIGEAGEQYANRQLIRHFLKEGYQIREENAHLCRLENEHTGQTAEVCRPDSNHYHQAGWDIAVRKTKKTEGESPSEEQTDYYEVKTCTMHSRYRNLLRISNEQMIKAVAAGERYHLIKVICDPSKLEVVESFRYDNLMQQLGSRMLKNREKGYVWQEVR